MHRVNVVFYNVPPLSVSIHIVPVAETLHFATAVCLSEVSCTPVSDVFQFIFSETSDCRPRKFLACEVVCTSHVFLLLRVSQLSHRTVS